MWTVKDKHMTYEQFKTEADNARKDLRLVSRVCDAFNETPKL